MTYLALNLIFQSSNDLIESTNIPGKIFLSGGTSFFKMNLNVPFFSRPLISGFWTLFISGHFDRGSDGCKISVR